MSDGTDHDHDDLYPRDHQHNDLRNRVKDLEDLVVRGTQDYGKHNERLDALEKDARETDKRLDAIEDAVKELSATVETIRKVAVGLDRQVQSFAPWSKDITDDVNAISDVAKDLGKLVKEGFKNQHSMNVTMLQAIAFPVGRVELLEMILEDARKSVERRG